MPNIDLSVVLPALVLGAMFRLDSSVPPHTIIEWRGPGEQPTEKSIEAWWQTCTPPAPRASVEERLAIVEADILSLKGGKA
jgi:hypothetical protein